MLNVECFFSRQKSVSTCVHLWLIHLFILQPSLRLCVCGSRQQFAKIRVIRVTIFLF
jgi:hypothetical protein